jgi:UDP-N-acetylmuramate: L-alanyl-gamma-D-glutamyl-meso-diaminopimelate ligase
MNTASIAQGIGKKASAHASNEDLLQQMESELRPGDAVIFMSSSSFSGIQHQLARKLNSL